MTQELTADFLRHLLHYDPLTGDWIWVNPPATSKLRRGDSAGSITGKGYLQIMIKGRSYYASRLAFLYMLGEWPSAKVDHKNRITYDDRWENLREATHSQNMANRGLSRNNTSGVIGVCWNRADRKWMVRVNNIYLGSYDAIEEATAVRDKFAAEWHGEFAQLNSERVVS